MINDPCRLHFNALKSSFEFARASSLSWSQGADEAYANQLGIVLSCIKSGHSCGTDQGQLLNLFLTSSWEGRGDTERLWNAYAAAGYIDTERELDAYLQGSRLQPHGKSGHVKVTPLEMAAALAHERAFHALLQCGANVQRMPSRNWGPAKKPMTPFGFLRFAVRNDVKRDAMIAMAAKAMGANPLELAIFSNDLQGFVGLIAAGESILSVPSRKWDVPSRKAKGDGALEGFIKSACKDADLCLQFNAVATQALMDACIAGARAMPGAPGPNPLKRSKKRPAALSPGSAQTGLADVPVASQAGPSALIASSDGATQRAQPAFPHEPTTPRMRRRRV